MAKESRGWYGPLGTQITKEGNLQKGNLNFAKDAGKKIGAGASMGFKQAKPIPQNARNRFDMFERQDKERKVKNTLVGIRRNNPDMDFGLMR